MKALRLHARGDLRLHDEDDPCVGEEDVLVRVTAVGLCGSDRLWYTQAGIGDAGLARPLVLGHELAGVIESGPRAGERVAVDPAIPCGVCAVCERGDGHLCPDIRFAGHGETDGGLRELIAWPERLLHPIPDALPDDEAALLEPLGVALHARDLGQIESGMEVGVYGCGPIGLLLVRLLTLAGARVAVATDPLLHRLAAAGSLGAEATRGPKSQASSRPLPSAGLDVAFEAAGENDAIDDALADLRPGGRLVVVGIPAANRTSFDAAAARRKGVTIALCRRMTARDLPRAIDLVVRGEVTLRPLVSERHPLAGWQRAFAALTTKRGLKVVVEPRA
ncbi:MAG: zinc-dependent alcohol dehydrogenase [Gaiellaceae bacterium]